MEKVRKPTILERENKMEFVMKNLYMITTGISQKLPIKPYKQYDADNIYHVNSYQGLTQAGFCEALLFADFCKRENLVFDEIHYQSNTVTNMAPSQLAVILKTLGLMSTKTTHWSGNALHWTNDLDYHLQSDYPNIKHPECDVIQNGAKNVLWILNSNGIRKFRQPGFSPRTVEGYVLQSDNWGNVFQKGAPRKTIQSELLRNPSEIEQCNILNKVKNENPEFMSGVHNLDLMEVEARAVIGNEKLFKMTKQDIEQLLGLIAKSYNWKIK